MIGRSISDRYRIEDRLGSGGMSTVYLALDTILERRVAVKVLAEHLSGDENFVARFRREALAVAKLIHPNIVQVFDTGVDDGHHYIVMEYVEGESTAQLLRREGRLDPATAVEIGVQACEGLEYAHKHRIVHRDVKPGNLMTVERAEGGTNVKLTDFGIAKAAEQTRITQIGSVVGTAAYLSPEQARGDEATYATDVYSLGVVLYQFLAGRVPFESSNLTELALRQQNERPISPREYNPEVPEELGWAVLRALEIDPAARYRSARELARSLREGLQGQGEPLPSEEELTQRIRGRSETAVTTHLPQADPPPARRASVEEPAPATYAPSPPPPSQPRSNDGRTARILATLALLVALLAAAVGIVSSQSGDERQVEVRQVVEGSVPDQVEGLQALIEDNRR